MLLLVLLLLAVLSHSLATGASKHSALDSLWKKAGGKLNAMVKVEEERKTVSRATRKVGEGWFDNTSV